MDGHLGCFHVWLLRISLLQTLVHNEPFESLLSILLHRYPEVELSSLILKSPMENRVLCIKLVVEVGCITSGFESGRSVWYLVRPQL